MMILLKAYFAYFTLIRAEQKIRRQEKLHTELNYINPEYTMINSYIIENLVDIEYMSGSHCYCIPITYCHVMFLIYLLLIFICQINVLILCQYMYRQKSFNPYESKLCMRPRTFKIGTCQPRHAVRPRSTLLPCCIRNVRNNANQCLSVSLHYERTCTSNNHEMATKPCD